MVARHGVLGSGTGFSSKSVFALLGAFWDCVSKAGVRDGLVIRSLHRHACIFFRWAGLIPQCAHNETTYHVPYLTALYKFCVKTAELATVWSLALTGRDSETWSSGSLGPRSSPQKGESK